MISKWVGGRGTFAVFMNLIIFKADMSAAPENMTMVRKLSGNSFLYFIKLGSAISPRLYCGDFQTYCLKWQRSHPFIC